MTKILLFGINGKMGKTIINLVENSPEYKIVAGVDKTARTSFDIKIYDDINKVCEDFDVVIDFSRPESLNSILSFCERNDKAVVLCTTGFSSKELCDIKTASDKIAIFRSSNMSIGINVINNLLKKVSNFLYKDFDIEIIEKHHNQKIDAPSGTAILLADTIKSSIKDDVRYVYGREGSKKREKNEITLHALRGGNIIGEHDVIFAGEGETISLTHNAISRDVFAIGALKASSFIKERESGLYDMDDLIKDAII